MLTHEGLDAYPRPKQPNGVEHYDVIASETNGDLAAVGRLAGRLTRRTAPKTKSPGWYVWIAKGKMILRDKQEKVVYLPTPEAALKAMWEALSSTNTQPQ